jgi:hypothetical protein
MKKFILVLLSILLAISFFSCDSNNTSSVSSQNILSYENGSNLEDTSSIESEVVMSSQGSDSYLKLDETKSQEYNEAIKAYNKFLSEEIVAIDITKEGNVKIGVNDTDAVDGEHYINSYALFDVNNDGIPELHTKSLFYNIYSYKDGGVVRLYASNHNMMNGLVYPLENGALVTEKVSAGTEYTYTTFNDDGKSISVYFDCISYSAEIIHYYFNRAEVSKEEYEKLTKDYKETMEKKAEITWYEYHAVISTSSSSEVVSKESASSVENTSSEEVGFEAKIEVSEDISQEDKEKALMYIDTLGSIAYDLGWDENYELPPRSLVKWYVYRTYNKDTISSYLSENKASYCFNKQEVENEVFKYFDTPQLTSLLEFSEKYEVSSSDDFSHLPQKSLKLNYVEKTGNSFKLYFTITQESFDVPRDMILTVRENSDGFKFVSYVPNTPEIDKNLLKDTVRHEFWLSGNNAQSTQLWINLPKSWTKDETLKLVSPNGFSVYFHMIKRFEGLQDYSQLFKEEDEYYIEERNTIESGKYNYYGQIGKWYHTYDRYLNDYEEHVLYYIILTEYKLLCVEVYVDDDTDINKVREEFEKYLPTLEIGKCTQW